MNWQHGQTNQTEATQLRRCQGILQDSCRQDHRQRQGEVSPWIDLCAILGTASMTFSGQRDRQINASLSTPNFSLCCFPFDKPPTTSIYLSVKLTTKSFSSALPLWKANFLLILSPSRKAILPRMFHPTLLVLPLLGSPASLHLPMVTKHESFTSSSMQTQHAISGLLRQL